MQVAERTPEESPRLDFTGRPLEFAGWFALTLVGTALVIPLAWVSAAVGRWLCRHTTFSDGTTVDFRGTGGDVVVWHVFYVLAMAGQSAALYAVAGEGIAALLTVFLISYVVIIAIMHTLIKWFVFNMQLSSGPQLSFTGSYVGLFGWYMALAVALYTVVGWAWVAAAMYRWLARHVRGRGVAFEFRGQGHQMLWRGLVTAAAAIFVIPIPWAGVWLTRWLIQSISLTRREEGELSTPA
jgi:hypothetical protein